MPGMRVRAAVSVRGGKDCIGLVLTSEEAAKNGKAPSQKRDGAKGYDVRCGERAGADLAGLRAFDFCHEVPGK
jgi:hypothetical protein